MKKENYYLQLIKIYAITGTAHGSLISALSEGAARRLSVKTGGY